MSARVLTSYVNGIKNKSGIYKNCEQWTPAARSGRFYFQLLESGAGIQGKKQGRQNWKIKDKRPPGTAQNLQRVQHRRARFNWLSFKIQNPRPAISKIRGLTSYIKGE